VIIKFLIFGVHGLAAFEQSKIQLLLIACSKNSESYRDRNVLAGQEVGWSEFEIRNLP
jgi:hypothetical protein